MKRLYRSRKDKVLAGICGGIGEYFGIDPVMVRVVTILVTLFTGVPLVVYLFSIFIIPLAPLQEGNPAAPLEMTKPIPTPEEKEREKARMAEHVKILGIIYIAFSALAIVAAALIFSLLVGSGLITGDEETILIVRIIGYAVSGLLVLLALPGLFAGLGLLKYESWGRVLALVLGVINLVNIPFGTFLGIYTIWVLTNREAQELFS